tara:strand:- start:9928 stop:10245 length:318 start_codon:yes stop_codon:yes gene_type:complete
MPEKHGYVKGGGGGSKKLTSAQKRLLIKSRHKTWAEYRKAGYSTREIQQMIDGGDIRFDKEYEHAGFRKPGISSPYRRENSDMKMRYAPGKRKIQIQERSRKQKR